MIPHGRIVTIVSRLGLGRARITADHIDSTWSGPSLETQTRAPLPL